MLFSTDGKVPVARHSTEDAVDMGYWQAGSCVSLLLNLGDTNNFAAQALILERTPQLQPVNLDYMIPILMDYAHLLQWHGRHGAGSENCSPLTRALFDDVSRVSNHPFAIGGDTGVSILDRRFLDSLSPFDDIPF
jgi:hypothetical protein